MSASLRDAPETSLHPGDPAAAFAAGQAEAFADLYDQFADRIYGFVFRRVGHRESAEDLTSQIFLKAFERRRSFAGGNFQAWIFRIAQNAVIDHYRTAKPTAALEAVQRSDGRDLESETADRVLMQKVLAALDTLAAPVRSIIIMRLWDGLSFGEIADIVGKREGAVKMAYGRALTKIQASAGLGLIIIIMLFNPYG